MNANTAACLGAVLFTACNAVEPSAAAPWVAALSKEDSGVETCRAAAAASPSTTPLRVRDLEPRAVIGLLGQPLGVVTRVDGTIVDGASLHDKVHASSYLLRVERVAATRLPEPVVMEFSGDAELGLPTETFALYAWRTGKKAKSLDSDEIAKLNEGYVGSSVSVYAYETGRFGGVPACLPQGTPLWQDRGFSFRSSLVVVERLK